MSWIDPDDTPSNPTIAERPVFSEIAEDRAITRRKVLQGGAATAALTFLAGHGFAVAKPGSRGNDDAPGLDRQRGASGLLGFQAVETGTTPAFDGVLIAPGYSVQFLAPWGDPVDPAGPAYVDDGGNTPAQQAEQLGMGHDGMEYFPLEGSARGLLAINHEYTITHQLFPADWYDVDGNVLEDELEAASEKEQNAHGIAVVEVRRDSDDWKLVGDGGYGRRVTTYTEMDISGPAAGHDLLKWGERNGTTTDGTANNCSSGRTPWGTYVTCEENFNGYFWVGDDGGGANPPEGYEELFPRYGIGGKGFGYIWGGVDERWRADLNPGRTNTYGWNVEIDPFDPTSRPVKRTAMGRFKHEGATFTESRARQVVCYMGDDERFDYLYKYVSDEAWSDVIDRGDSPLDEGTLYVARFHDNGTGEWIPLVHGEGPLTETNGFESQADVLIKTRLAGDAVEATPMDRPEWTAVHPQTGEVFATMTNNSRRRKRNAANPLTPDNDGFIISIQEDGGDNAATTFDWDWFLFGGDGTQHRQDLPFVDEDAAFGSPDGLGFDHEGRLWIQTDGGQPYGMNDQMLAADPATRDVKRFFMGPTDCEVTGLTFTPDGKTAFINIQHPNDGVPPTNTHADQPVYPPDTEFNRPRSSTVVITKDDGGVIGS